MVRRIHGQWRIRARSPGRFPRRSAWATAACRQPGRRRDPAHRQPAGRTGRNAGPVLVPGWESEWNRGGGRKGAGSRGTDRRQWRRRFRRTLKAPRAASMRGHGRRSIMGTPCSKLADQPREGRWPAVSCACNPPGAKLGVGSASQGDRKVTGTFDLERRWRRLAASAPAGVALRFRLKAPPPPGPQASRSARKRSCERLAPAGRGHRHSCRPPAGAGLGGVRQTSRCGQPATRHGPPRNSTSTRRSRLRGTSGRRCRRQTLPAVAEVVDAAASGNNAGDLDAAHAGNAWPKRADAADHGVHGDLACEACRAGGPCPRPPGC
jgi:hypothetical protein